METNAKSQTLEDILQTGDGLLRLDFKLDVAGLDSQEGELCKYSYDYAIDVRFDSSCMTAENAKKKVCAGTLLDDKARLFSDPFFFMRRERVSFYPYCCESLTATLTSPDSRKYRPRICILFSGRLFGRWDT